MARNMSEHKVKLEQKLTPTGLSGRDLVGRTKVGEIIMIRKDLNRMPSAKEVVTPVFQSFDDSQEFSVIDIIVDLSGEERT